MPHDLHYPILKELGLTETEAVIYEVLLEQGPKPAKDLVIPSGLSRGNVYNAVTALVKKGLATEKKGVKTVFEAAPPSSLQTILNQEQNRIRQLATSFESILPQLTSEFRFSTGKPVVRIFEGLDGIKQIYNEMLNDKAPIFALVSADEPDPEMFRWLRGPYATERIKRQIQATAIFGRSNKTDELIEAGQQEFRKAKISPQEYEFKGEINAFGNKVAFISYTKDNLIGAVIDSPAISLTIQSAIRLAFDLLPAQAAA